MKKLGILLFSMLLGVGLRADTPLNATDLTLGYQDSKHVLGAKDWFGDLTDDMLKFLAGDGPIGEKVAMVCSMGWGESQQSLNAMQFEEYLVNTKGDMNFSAEDFTVLGYMQGMASSDLLEAAKYNAEAGVRQNPESFTSQIILALIKSEMVIVNEEENWCPVYTWCNEVRTNKRLKKDLNDQSIKGIFDYIEGYEEYCNK